MKIYKHTFISKSSCQFNKTFPRISQAQMSIRKRHSTKETLNWTTHTFINCSDVQMLCGAQPAMTCASRAVCDDVHIMAVWFRLS